MSSVICYRSVVCKLKTCVITMVQGAENLVSSRRVHTDHLRDSSQGPRQASVPMASSSHGLLGWHTCSDRIFRFTPMGCASSITVPYRRREHSVHAINDTNIYRPTITLHTGITSTLEHRGVYMQRRAHHSPSREEILTCDCVLSFLGTLLHSLTRRLKIDCDKPYEYIT